MPSRNQPGTHVTHCPHLISHLTKVDLNLALAGILALRQPHVTRILFIDYQGTCMRWCCRSGICVHSHEVLPWIMLPRTGLEEPSSGKSVSHSINVITAVHTYALVTREISLLFDSIIY